MPITETTSLSLIELLDVLSKDLKSYRKKSPLVAPQVIIPNSNMRMWMIMNISRLQGIATNIDFTFIEKSLEFYFYKRNGIYFDTENRFFPGIEANQRKILTYLLEHKDNQDFVFLQSYLNSISRAFSLSARLALLFKDYELNRFDWISHWAREKGIDYPRICRQASPFPEENEYLKIQKSIYQDLFLTGKIENQDPLYKTESLSQFYVRAANDNSFAKSSVNTDLYIFCLSNLADTYMHVLEKISEIDLVHIHFYQFHSGATHLKMNNQNLLARFAKPQMYMSSRLENKSEKTIIEPKDTYPKGLLELRKLLKGEETIPENLSSSINDSSVRFWNSPSVFREVEVVANDILHKMNQNAELEYTDFAILVTDMNSYRPAIEWVFDGGIMIQYNPANESSNRPLLGFNDSILGRQKIPYSLTDIKASDSSVLYRFLMDIYDICSSELIPKKSVLQILHNPLVYGKLVTEIGDIREYDDLIERLCVVYENNKGDNDPFQISNGLKRARLSKVVTANELFKYYNMVELEDCDEKVIEELTIFWENLLQARDIFRTMHTHNQKNWTTAHLESVKETFEQMLEWSDEYAQERILFQEWLVALEDWKDIQLTDAQENIELFRFVTNQAFEKIPYKKGSYLTAGISVSLLQPMRPIPFRNVYILGLGEGKFPGSADRSQLNLRRDVVQDWDMSRKEIQESLLWETLHSPTDSVTLSYVGDNLLEDKKFEPCSPMYEIMQAFGIQKATTMPLTSYSKFYVNDTNLYNRGIVSYDFSRIAVTDKIKDYNLETIFQKPENQISKLPLEISKRIALRSISDFLSDPMEFYLRKRLGMYHENEMDEEDDSDIFHLSAIQESEILKEIYGAMIADLVLSEEWKWDQVNLQERLDGLLNRLESAARFPRSSFGVLQRNTLLDYLLSASELFLEWKNELIGGKYYRFLTLGDLGHRNADVLILDPLSLDMIGSKTNFTLEGEWEHVIEKPNGELIWIYPKGLEGKPSYASNDYYGGYKDYWKVMSFPFLSCLALEALGKKLTILSFKSRLPKKTKGKSDGVLILRIDSRKNAYEYLITLIRMYMNDSLDFFPRKAFLSYYVNYIQAREDKKKPENSQFEQIERYLDESAWQKFLKDNIFELENDLSNVIRLYPNIRELIFKSKIEFAKNFYKPFLDWLVIQ